MGADGGESEDNKRHQFRQKGSKKREEKKTKSGKSSKKHVAGTPEEVNGDLIEGLGTLQAQALQRTPPTVVFVTDGETLGSDTSSGSEFPMSEWFSVIPSEALASAPRYDSGASKAVTSVWGSQIHRGEQKTRTTINQFRHHLFATRWMK